MAMAMGFLPEGKPWSPSPALHKVDIHFQEESSEGGRGFSPSLTGEGVSGLTSHFQEGSSGHQFPVREQ